MLLMIGNIVMAFLLFLVVLVGGCYVCTYEKAPLGERLQVLGVGLGICLGIALLLITW